MSEIITWDGVPLDRLERRELIEAVETLRLALAVSQKQAALNARIYQLALSKERR